MLVRTEEQQELARTVRGLLDRRADSASTRRAMESEDGFDRALWSTLCDEIGVAGLAIPEEYDGAGAGLVETSVVLEELGRSLAPSPFLAGTLATVSVLLHGSDEQRTELLPRLSAGVVATLAASEVADGLVLDGQAAELVLGFDADILQVREEPPLSATAMDPTTRLTRLATTGAPEDVVDVGRALVASMQVGVAQRGLDMTVAYVKERVQFGRPIGSFQAVKHRLADCHVLIESARSAAWGAADAAAAYADRRDAGSAAALHVLAGSARSWCTEALDHVAAETVQLHGGIAITWEHDAQLVFKRAHALGQLLGQPHHVRADLV